jgi:uncharacterized membrane protein
MKIPVPKGFENQKVTRVLKMQTKLRKGEIAHKEYRKFINELEEKKR